MGDKSNTPVNILVYSMINEKKIEFQQSKVELYADFSIIRSLKLYFVDKAAYFQDRCLLYLLRHC
jgi:hypothetical protein